MILTHSLTLTKKYLIFLVSSLNTKLLAVSADLLLCGRNSKIQETPSSSQCFAHKLLSTCWSITKPDSCKALHWSRKQGKREYQYYILQHRERILKSTVARQSGYVTSSGKNADPSANTDCHVGLHLCFGLLWHFLLSSPAWTVKLF